MAINTLVTIKDALTSFVAGHGQLQRIEFEAEDQKAPSITEGNEFPMLFVAPKSVRVDRAMNIHRLRIYVYARINDNRLDIIEDANDTSLILRDIAVWWNGYNQSSDIEILEGANGEFVSDRELDNLVGYYADFEFQIPSHGRCDVPVNIVPVPPIPCPEGTVNVNQSNSSLLAAVNVASGVTEPYNVADSVITLNTNEVSVNVLATDSKNFDLLDIDGNPIVVDSVVGDEVTLDISSQDGIEVISDTASNILYTDSIPSGTTNPRTILDGDIQINSVSTFSILAQGVQNIIPKDLDGNVLTVDSVIGEVVTFDINASMNVDFEADKILVDTGETINFTDLTDLIPTYWAWRFEGGGRADTQNPSFIFETTGDKDVTLIAANGNTGGFDLKTNYITVETAPFIMKVDSGADGQFTIPTTGTGYNYKAFWYKVSDPSENGSFTGVTGNQLITFADANTEYIIEIRGLFPRWYQNNNAEANKLIELVNDGDVIFGTDQSYSFSKAINMDGGVDYTPLQDDLINGSRMYFNCYLFNPPNYAPILSSLTSGEAMYYRCYAFDQDFIQNDPINGTILLEDASFMFYLAGLRVIKLQAGAITTVNFGSFWCTDLEVLELIDMSVSFTIQYSPLLVGAEIDALANSVKDLTGSTFKIVTMTTAQYNSCTPSIWTNKNWQINQV